MGSNTSKSSTETAALTQKNDLDKDTASNSDPRSPTPEIARTPLQVKNGAKHNITKNADLRKKFENDKTEEKLIHNNPILSAVIKNHLQSYDPRSPTQDFERTPIVIASQIGDEDKKLLKTGIDNNNYGSPSLIDQTIENSCNDSFDANDRSPDLFVPKNLCDDFCNITLNSSLKPEEPLGSSTASNEVIENEISKECTKPQFLETNFEYIGTEADKFEDSEVEIGEMDDTNEKTEYVKNIPFYKLLNEDPRSPSMGIDRTPIVVPKDEQEVKNVEEMSDDSLIKALQTNATTNNVQDHEDKPDGILIYEDKTNNLNDTPKKSKSESNSGSRTPLSCMKNKTDGHGRSKSTNTLLDSKNQKAKLQKRVSQIPRLKALKHSKHISSESSVSLRNMSNGISGDCENTPPHSHRDKWDKDSSIVL